MFVCSINYRIVFCQLFSDLFRAKSAYYWPIFPNILSIRFFKQQSFAYKQNLVILDFNIIFYNRQIILKIVLSPILIFSQNYCLYTYFSAFPSIKLIIDCSTSTSKILHLIIVDQLVSSFSLFSARISLTGSKSCPIEVSR